MTHKALIRRLQISCLGLDRIDPLCLLVDDVIEALTQPELCKYGQEPKSCTSSPMDCQCAIDAALAQPEQEPVVLRFNEWTVGKNDLSDHIYIGELTLAGIEDNLEGPEFGEAEIERFDAVIEALQEKLVTGRECKKVPLIAYIGVNNATPPQRTWVGLTDEEVYEIYASVQEEVNKHWENGGTAMMFPPTLYKAIEAKLKERNA